MHLINYTIEAQYNKTSIHSNQYWCSWRVFEPVWQAILLNIYFFIYIKHFGPLTYAKIKCQPWPPSLIIRLTHQMVSRIMISAAPLLSCRPATHCIHVLHAIQAIHAIHASQTIHPYMLYILHTILYKQLLLHNLLLCLSCDFKLKHIFALRCDQLPTSLWRLVHDRCSKSDL